jgi:hypothetical protein
MSDARIHANKLRKEADALLKHTELFRLLGNFGNVKLGGSHEYDLMVERDLDFGVVIKEMNPTIRSEIAKLFAAQSWTYGLHINDRINFEPLSNLKAPRGLFLGLTIPFAKERWNVDVWFMIHEGFEENENAKLVKTASPEQREIILDIKFELFKRGLDRKGSSSVEVYKAVLLRNVKTVKEFLKQSQ